MHALACMQRSSRRESSTVWSESNAIIEGMSKPYKYSPEEKKERIEKYRSKRNLRNFNKRIKVIFNLIFTFVIYIFVCSSNRKFQL